MRLIPLLTLLAAAAIATVGCVEDKGRSGESAVAVGASEESAPDEEAACPPAPQTDVPLLTLADGTALRWPLDKGCVDVTYTPAAADYSDAIGEAVAGWSSPECSRLCLDAPRAVTDAQDAEAADGERVSERHRLRFTAAPGALRSTPKIDEDSGRILLAHVRLSTDAPASTRSVIAAVGLVLGLGRPSGPEVDSVMHQTSAAATPTPADTAALCTLYGVPAYCEPVDRAR